MQSLLHDCRTNYIKHENNILEFHFPKGYYLLNDNQPKQTGKAKMQCHLLNEEIDGISVYIYKNKSGKVIREDWSNNFLMAINEGTFEFEFEG